MAKPDGEEAKWGTWEELLLAFAVNRYGTNSWDSVAVELQKRSTAPAKLLSAHNCKLKYLDLKHRYVNDDDEEEKTEALLEELRKLRVAELKRQVEKYDLSILSLQLKKKQLEEERAENGESKSTDLPIKPEPVRTGSVKEELDKPVIEDSYNGSSESVEKPVKVEPVNESPEDSDVQSSISKKVNNDKVLRGCSSGDERHKEIRDRDVKQILPVEYQPLIAFLDKITSYKLGSIFQRRLESQETEMYSNLVRQHVDLEIVRTWLENGRYLSCKSKFFRDLLLLASNAIVFFKKSSPEFVAATELRQLILKEIPQTKFKSDSSPGKQTSPKPASLAKKDIAKPPDSLLLKTNISGSMIVCRKRSSIAAKSSASASGGGDKMREQTITLPGENVVVDTLQQPNQLATNAGGNRITKRRQDRSASASASLKKKEKGHCNTTSVKDSAAVVDRNQGKGESSSQHEKSKVDNRNEQSNTDVKKRSAANFLNRMKQSSSSNSGLLLDALKSRPLSSDSKGRSVQKKKDSGTGGGRKELAASKNLEAKQGKEKGSPMKKNIGRPPKRGADPSPMSGKRSWEEVESAAVAPKPKKRARR